VWRQIFEDGDHGRIDDMLVAKNCEYTSLLALLLNKNRNKTVKGTGIVLLYTLDLPHISLEFYGF